MLFNLLSNPLALIIFVAALSIVISVHEAAHAYAADQLGDPTARLAGRLTLDPRSHVDPLGLIFLLIVGFGWGRPVPFDPFNLKNPRRDSAIISFAGPFSNLVMAIVGSLVLKLFTFTSPSLIPTIGREFISIFIHLNIILGVFNLLPIAPLDGFKIVGGILTDREAANWYSMERYGIIFLLVFIFPLFGDKSMLEIFLSPIVRFLSVILIGS